MLLSIPGNDLSEQPQKIVVLNKHIGHFSKPDQEEWKSPLEQNHTYNDPSNGQLNTVQWFTIFTTLTCLEIVQQ